MNEITDRMKKYLFFLSAVSIALFTACSSGEELAEATHEMTQEEYNAIIAEANMDSEVQIRLGTGSQSSSVTRAPLESGTDKLFTTPAGQYLGIFCLAQQNQTTSGTLPIGSVATGDIDWSSTSATTKFFLMARNQAARVVKIASGGQLGNVTVGQDGASEVQFMNAGLTDTQIHFYPYGNWYNYYFYGYYPRQADANITATADKVTVNYTLNGTQDVIWGKAMPAAAYAATGFNAKYIRTKQTEHGGSNELEDLPQLAMSHKLTQVRFWVKTTSSNYNTYGYGTGANDKKFQISALKLTNVPTNWTLTIADKSATGNTEGKMTPQTNIGLGDITPKKMQVQADGKTPDPANTNDDEALSSAIDIEKTTTKLVGYAMIPTTDMMTSNNIAITDRTDPEVPYFDFTISYTDTGNNTSTFEFQNQKITLPTGGLEANHVYNVIIDIPVPEEIDMSAILDPWVSVTVTETSPQNISITVD